MKRLAPCRIVVCYPLEPRHLAEIRAAAPGCEVVDAGQAGIAHEILNADLFGGHAKVPMPWDDVVRTGACDGFNPPPPDSTTAWCRQSSLPTFR